MRSGTNAGVTRRRFNQGLVAAAAGTMAAPAFLRGQSLNNKLNIAVIGAGGRGAADTASVAGENIVALCDVNAKSLEGAAKRYPVAKQYSDFRKLFENAKDFDAVVIATCEHTHAAATMLALKHNKHVYCEKPLTHDIWEARQIREAAGKLKVATQMGIQIHATENYRKVVELVQAGAIGPVREAHVWVSRAWGLQSEEAAKRNHDIVYVADRPKAGKAAPDALNWDLWLGPAAYRPYDDVYVPGPKWYRWWDFGNGTMSDLGSHWNDLPFWALKLQSPLTIEASGPAPHPEIAPASMSATYEYGARGDMPPVKFTWHQGENKPEIWKTGGIPKWGDGCLFIGDKGMLLADYDKHVLLPEKDFVDFKRPAPTIARSPGHHEEWIEACKTGKPTAADFQYSGLLTEANHLGNVAFRVGKKLQWDPVALRATNAPEADAYIRRERRAGWEL
ncbi:MAG: gfo/Idh/MocA family oxidoreductase [Phycisphaerales bacterium]|jgi:predicted dehydrogenase|nr:gfo/Idh/MocA family oxidoreductase [Phycisphaerales bacterium]